MSRTELQGALNALCSACEAECKATCKVPECWGQYGNPCAKYLDEMERIESEAKDDVD